MFELKVTTDFAAAHQLKMVADKCENLHGHNWKVEAHVAGQRLNDAGVLVDFGALKACLKNIMAELDHKFLNELDCFISGNPSSENIAVYIADSLAALLAVENVRVSRVSVWESDNSCATYIPD
jgi:6-pyruvoyltetrahydropterin/6-carboxytetrahydropterin synthase